MRVRVRVSRPRLLIPAMSLNEYLNGSLSSVLYLGFIPRSIMDTMGALALATEDPHPALLLQAGTRVTPHAQWLPH